jgi:tetratricopeptide (TPR) repeat protein
VNVIYEETQGNPFFVEEVYKHLVEEGKIFDAAGQFRLDISIDEVDVPENVRLVLDRRLNRLGEKTLQVLTAAAVIGRSFSFKLLVSLLDHVDIDDLLTAIEEAQRMGLMVSSSEGPEAPFAFAHELVRQTLLASLSLPRRQRLHLHVADAIERVYASAENEHAAEIAHHLVQAGSSADAQRVVQSLALAGHYALEAAAYEEALRHFESALLHGDAIDLRRRAELLSCLALAQRGLGRWDDALASWRDALDICTNLGDHELVDGICFKIVVMLMWVGRYREAEQIAQRSLVQLPGEASTDRIRARTAVGLIKTVAGNYRSAQDAFRSALASADRLSDHKLQALILAFRSHCNLYFLRLPEAIEDGVRSAELRHAEGSLWLHAQRLCWMQQALYSLGRAEEAARIRDELEPLARKSGHFGALALCLRIGAWTEFGKDLDLNKLEQQLRQDLEINDTVSLQPWIATSHTQLSLVEFFRGNWGAGLEYAEEAYRLELLDVREGFGAGALFRMRAYAGDRTGALALLSSKRATLPRSGEFNTLGSWAMLLLVIEGLVVLGEQEQAAQLYPLVRQLLDTGTICLAWISRFSQTVAGVAATAGRQWDAAEKHFHLALQQAEHFPHRLEQVEIHRFYGAMLLDRGAPNDRKKVQRLLSEAVAEYTRIGMPHHSALTKALLDKC